MPETFTDPPTSGQEPLSALHERVLTGTLNAMAVAVPGITAVIVAQALVHDEVDQVTAVLSAYTLSFPLLRLAYRRLSFRVAAVALLSLLILTMFLVATRGGLGVGNISVAIVAMILSVLFFGRRGGALALLAMLVSVAVAGMLVHAEVGPPMNLEMWDPRTPRFWARALVAMALFGTAILVTQVYVVEWLVRQARAGRDAARRERNQRLALEESEEQRRAAEHALEEARRADALARLAGGIAHDFNNALTVIGGAAELLRTGAADTERSVETILHATRTAGDLTRQLLSLGNRQISNAVPTDMGQLLVRLGDAFARVIPSDVEFDLQPGPSGTLVQVDVAQMERALLNLVINARDAMPTGGTLTLRCTREPDADPSDSQSVVIAVSDTGEGMDAETLERIFEPFFTTKGEGHGTGLGLATVKAFARECGGRVEVQSTPRQGTTMALHLPEYVGDVGSIVLPDRLGESTPRPARSAGARVLVVEDRPDVRAHIVSVLTSGGFDTTAVSNGDDALRLLEQQTSFDLMCIDAVMPGVPTATVIERAEELSPDLPILLCSGYVEAELLRRKIRTGRYPFLPKPFSSQQLLDCVNDMLPVSVGGSRPNDAPGAH